MSYQKEIRDYMTRFNEKEIIIANTVLVDKFEHIPETAYYKTLERLVSYHELAKVGKGIYCRPQKDDNGTIVVSGEEEILDYYINANKKCPTGVIVGDTLYNKIGLTERKSDKVMVYSNRLEESRKRIGNISLRKIKLRLNAITISTIEYMDVLQNYETIDITSDKKAAAYFRHIAETYDEKIVQQVNNEIHYKKRTLAFLVQILHCFGVENQIDKLLNRISTYEMPDVAKIVEV
jgi:hypothetical protein